MQKKRGFTLIEMLIVIVIIGILASALIPRLMSLQERARDIQRITDVRTIAHAAGVYKADNGKYPSWKNNFSNFNPAIPNQYATLVSGEFQMWYSPNTNGGQWCVFNNLINTATTATNRWGDCTSAITIHDLLVPKYMTKMPRAPKKYILGGTRAPSNTWNLWQALSYRDGSNNEIAPTDYYNYILVKRGGIYEDGIVVFTPTENMNNANWVNIGFSRTPASLSTVMTDWAHWPDSVITTDPMNVGSTPTPTDRSIEKITYDLCTKVVKQALIEPVPLMGGANGGTCYIPIANTAFKTANMSNEEQHLRYLYLQ